MPGRASGKRGHNAATALGGEMIVTMTYRDHAKNPSRIDNRMPPINRRALICGLAGVVGSLPSPSHAQAPGKLPWWTPWREIPSIAVMATADDYRLPFFRAV